MEKSRVKMVTPEGRIKTRMYKQTISAVASLGREIKISPKSHATFNAPGFEVEFFVPTVSVCIGIGNDYTAELVMAEDAWHALKRGEKIHIETAKSFKEKYL